MSVFSDNQCDSIPLQAPTGDASLRPGQIGALCSIHAHFLYENDPAIIALPTGYGKTAIHTALPFLFGSERVLLLTSSSILRSQIAEQFQSLDVIRKCNFIPDRVPAPDVYKLDHQISDAESWEALGAHDVVIGIPHGFRNQAEPFGEREREVIEELFDLVIVDEAHHSAAQTWKALLRPFPDSTKKVLATATPFRRDAKRLPGKEVFRYPVEKAKAEGFFAEIHLEPVSDQEDVDGAIARKAEEVLQNDDANGLDHLLLVRKDRIDRAEELLELYREETALDLELVHSRMGGTAVNNALDALRNQSADGVIGVDMLGEGIDIPRLKIAALHDPYRSLPITLQFIGRLARTNADDIGRAVVIAPEQKLRSGLAKLLGHDSEWNAAIEGLVEFLSDEEAKRREALDAFEFDESATFGLEVLDAISAYQHAKIYRVADFNIDATPDYDGERDVLQQFRWPDRNCVVLLTRGVNSPRWIKSEIFDTPGYNLHILYYHAESQILFITVSDKVDSVYDHLLDTYADCPRQLSLSDLNKSFRTLRAPRFINVGLRSRLPGSHTEAYRVMSGERADVAVRGSDAKRYHRGHAFALSDEEGSNATLGMSGNSKVWSNSNSRVGDLLSWYDRIAEDIDHEGQFEVGSAYLARVPMESTVSQIPSSVLAARWPSHIYETTPSIRWDNGEGELEETWALAVGFEIDTVEIEQAFEAEEANTSFEFDLRAEDGFHTRMVFDLDADDHFRYVDVPGEEPPEIKWKARGEEAWVGLDEYLNRNLPTFYLADLSTLRGSGHAAADPSMRVDLLENQLEALNWDEANVSITDEDECADEGWRNIHEFVADRLTDDDWHIVFRDHSSNEIADFIAFRETPDDDHQDLEVRFVHCKASSTDQPGSRVADFYDVVGQAARSLQYAHNLQELARHIQGRLARCRRVEFVTGDIPELDRLVASRPARQAYQIQIVQPGLSKEGISESVQGLLSGLQDVLDSRGCQHLTAWVSP